MDGVQLGARFSVATNRLQYCGPDGADAVLYRAIVDGHDLSAARRALGQFEALVPYLELIARKHRRDPFDPQVVEAYWVGNDLLDTFDRRDFLELLDRLVRRGLPRTLARRLSDHLPAQPIPHHAFHVSFVGVGNVTGHVRTTLTNMEACRPGWGEVVAVEPSSLTVESPSLVLDGSHLSLGAPRREVVPYDPRVLPAVEPGEWVALHWRTPAIRLDPDRLARLRRYTARSLEAANEALPGLGVFSPATLPSGGTGL